MLSFSKELLEAKQLKLDINCYPYTHARK